MLYVIFTRSFGFDFRPAKAVCRQFSPGDKPQLVCSEIKLAAIKAGAAIEANPPKRKRRTKV